MTANARAVPRGEVYTVVHGTNTWLMSKANYRKFLRAVGNGGDWKLETFGKKISSHTLMHAEDVLPWYAKVLLEELEQ